MGHYRIDIERAERNIRRKGRYFKTQKEVAELLGVSIGTLNRWQNDGTLPWLVDSYDEGMRVKRLKKLFDGKGNIISYYYVPRYDAQAILDKLKTE